MKFHFRSVDDDKVVDIVVCFNKRGDYIYFRDQRRRILKTVDKCSGVGETKHT